LSLVFDKVGAHYYDRIDVRLTGNDMKRAAKARLDAIDVATISLGGHCVAELVTLDGYKFVMDDGGWMLIRFSGTEPLLRIYTETTDQAAVSAILSDGRTIAGV
jgi:phosphomannomutase